MAVRVPTTLIDYEVRAVNSGNSKSTGKRWVSVVLEDAEAEQIRVSVPEDAQDEVLRLGLGKGEVVSIGAMACLGGNYGYLQWDGLVQRGSSSEVELNF